MWCPATTLINNQDDGAIVRYLFVYLLVDYLLCQHEPLDEFLLKKLHVYSASLYQAVVGETENSTVQ